MLLYMLCYHVMKEILNNSTNISKTNNYLWPQIFETQKRPGLNPHAEICLPSHLPTHYLVLLSNFKLSSSKFTVSSCR